MFLNTESHDLHSIDEHERSVIQINETEFLVQKIEMRVFYVHGCEIPQLTG